jgi:hypothetical protein
MNYRKSVGSLIVGMIIATTLSHPTYANPRSDDVEAQIEALQTQVHYEWLAGHFDKLEAIASKFRARNQVTSTGYYWLPLYYDGFSLILKVEPWDVAEKKWAKAYALWVKQFPNSPTPHIANASFLHQLGWAVRGTNYINEVHREARGEYQRRISDSRDFLRATVQVADKDPDFYALLAMDNFELDGDHDALKTDLDAGLKKFPWYEPYFYVGAEYFLPRWGGNEAAFSSWIDRAVKSTQANHGMGMLAKLYWHSRGGPEQYRDIVNKGPFWEVHLKRSISDELAHYPNWENAKKFILLACKANDPQEMRDLLKILSTSRPPTSNLNVNSFCG